MTGERTTETSLHPWGGQNALPMMEQVQPNPCMKAIWLSSPLEQLDSRVDLWESSTSKAGATPVCRPRAWEKGYALFVFWSSQTLTVKQKDLEMDSEKKEKNAVFWHWRMNFREWTYSLFSSPPSGHVAHLPRSPHCSLFLDLQRRMDSHPAAHTSQFSPRATASCSLCNPVKATAAAARLAMAVWLLGFEQTAGNQPESKEKNGDGEAAVNVNSLWAEERSSSSGESCGNRPVILVVYFFVINRFWILAVKDCSRIQSETKKCCISTSAKAETFTFATKWTWMQFGAGR